MHVLTLTHSMPTHATHKCCHIRLWALVLAFPTLLSVFKSGANHSKVSMPFLLQAKAMSKQEDCEAALDSLWSLQYMTGPGILCAFAGATCEEGAGPGSTSHTASAVVINKCGLGRWQIGRAFLPMSLTGWQK